jgi:hypothetical protein
MSEEAKLLQEAARARRAKEILEDPLVQEAFALIKAKLVDEWERCPMRDKDGREYLYLMMQLQAKFRAHFEQAVQRGKVADHGLAQIEQRRKLFNKR